MEQDVEERSVIGYVRVSTADQAGSGLGLDAQRSAIRDECARRGWTLVDVATDEAATGKILDRPGLHDALDRIASGDADTLLVAKLDRASRSVVDFGTLLDWFDQADAAFVALDLGVDTSTPAGRLVANVLASVAEWEASTIATRTRDGLTAKRARGEAISREAVSDNGPLAEEIRALRSSGLTLQASPTISTTREFPQPAVGPRGGRRACRRSSDTDDPVGDGQVAISPASNDAGAAGPRGSHLRRLLAELWDLSCRVKSDQHRGVTATEPRRMHGQAPVR